MKDLSSAELALFQRFIFERAGITLSTAKKALVMGRLGKRVSHYQLNSFGDYHRLLQSGEHPDEEQLAIDLLTTNETYFFRESKHFDFLREKAAAARHRTQAFRVWSAACSSGEEPYSMAMVLDDTLLGTTPWEVLGTDISTHVLQGAARALYPMERARLMPQAYLRKYCLKGTGEHEGRLLVNRALRAQVSFRQVNLNQPLPDLGYFDMVFLRNVMIYFSDDTKRQVVQRVLATLKPGGYLCVGHSESLTHVLPGLNAVAPAIYSKPA